MSAILTGFYLLICFCAINEVVEVCLGSVAVFINIKQEVIPVRPKSSQFTFISYSETLTDHIPTFS